jgi:hypothetical protein
MSEDTARTTAIETDIVSRTADDFDVDETGLADALEALAGGLKGHHSRLERYPYVSGEQRRAYAADSDEWGELLDPHGFDDELADAVRGAHHRQAKALFVANEADSADLDDASGVVIGVDTAEQFE